jgi:hypothetical protein
VLVNESFVRVIAEGRSPVGRWLRIGNDQPQIVGIVGDVQTIDAGFSLPGMTRAPIMRPPIVFLPAAQVSDQFGQLVHRWFSPVWAVRTSGGVNAEAALRRAIANQDPLLPLTQRRAPRK